MSATMQSRYIIIFIITLRGYDCIRFFGECQTIACLFDYSDQNPTQSPNKSCVTISYGIKYHYGYQISYDSYFTATNRYSIFMLKESPFNSAPEVICKYLYNGSIVTIDEVMVDWIHNRLYILTNRIRSGPIAKSDLYIPLEDFFTEETLAPVIGTDARWISYVSMQIDPYRRYLFVLAVRRPGVSNDYTMLRSELNRNNTLLIATIPKETDEYQRPLFYVDINELRIYVFRDLILDVFDYDGKLIRKLHLPCIPMDVVIYNGNLYMAAENVANTFSNKTTENNVIVVIPLNVSEHDLKVNEVYQMNTANECSLKIVDARSKRRLEDGKYLCDRTDCPELCEVDSSGDNCVCFKSKAKTIDGVRCYTCGQSNLTSLVQQPAIVNGEITYPSNFPWHAIIYNISNWEQVCGGTLISSLVVLTAAHCVTSPCKACVPPVILPELLKVALGKTLRSWNATELYEIRRNVTRVLVLDDYTGLSTNYANDMALLFLDSEVPVNQHVMPACLDYNLNQLPAHETLMGYVYGFGYTKDCGSRCSNLSDSLLHTTDTAIDLDHCITAMNSKKSNIFHRLSSDKFCLGNGTVSAAQQGDSGGGFTVVHQGLHFVMGVVSVKVIDYYRNRTNAYSFGAFTNVSLHMDWIKRNLVE